MNKADIKLQVKELVKKIVSVYFRCEIHIIVLHNIFSGNDS